jgi:hypothetical protein
MHNDLKKKTLLMLLRKYGWHSATCAVHNGLGKSHKCDCGWNELQNVLVAAKQAEIAEEKRKAA